MQIPYGKQNVSEEDIKSVVDILRSDFLTQGPQVPMFEKKLAELSCAKYATAVTSATSALHLACLSLGVTKSDIVWTVPNTFVASANCAIYCGATIDFVDIDPLTCNISVNLLEEKLKKASNSNLLPKVVIPVHLSGEPCDMKSIKKLSEEYGFRVIEDASHAVGAKYQGKPVGSSEFSDITVFSFHPVKIITTGEGGAALTNDNEIDRMLKLFRSHGITRDPKLMESPNENLWYYEQIELGYNYRMTDIHAALGHSQLNRLSDFIDARHSIAHFYDQAFKDCNLILPYRNPKNISSLHLYVIKVNETDHSRIFQFLRESGVGVNLHYIPIHTHPYYRKLGFDWGDFPIAENYYRTAVSLPIFPSLKLEQQKYIIDLVKTSLEF